MTHITLTVLTVYRIDSWTSQATTTHLALAVLTVYGLDSWTS